VKHSLYAISAAAVMTLALAGCGKEDAGTAASAATPSKSEETFRFRYATPIAQGSLSGKAADWFAAEVRKRSDGRVVFENYHGGSLLPAADMLPGLKAGTLAGAYVTPAYWPQSLPLYDITSTGFLTSDGVAVAQTVHKLQSENGHFSTELEKQGIKLLFPFFGSIAALGTVKPADGLGDIAKMRLRGAGRSGEAYTLAGSEIVAVPAPEIYEQIQRGVLDGFALWPYDIITAPKLQEVTQHISDAGLGMYSHASFAISLSAWQRLPDDLKNVVTEVANEYVEKHGPGELVKEEAAQCEQLRAAGVSLNVWTEEEQKKFADLAKDKQIESWRKGGLSNGHSGETLDAFYSAYMTTYQEFAAASGYQSPIRVCSGK